MIPGSWVGGTFPVSYFSFFYYPFYSSSPMSASIARVGVGDFTLFLDPFLLFQFSHLSFPLVLFHGVDPRAIRGLCVSYMRKPFLKLSTDGAIYHEYMSATC